ncbi:hypothetical protein BVRB_4g080670 [Beta vulgaris subsp. vulgaris]|nr:hypothetical protein BVRB_4g080670 [Beta vulgaris subsp. vulgaris]
MSLKLDKHFSASINSSFKDNTNQKQHISISTYQALCKHCV